MSGPDAASVLGRGPGRGSSAGEGINHTPMRRQAPLSPRVYTYLQIKSAEATAACRLHTQRCAHCHL